MTNKCVAVSLRLVALCWFEAQCNNCTHTIPTLFQQGLPTRLKEASLCTAGAQKMKERGGFFDERVPENYRENMTCNQIG